MKIFHINKHVFLDGTRRHDEADPNVFSAKIVNHAKK